MPDADSPNPIVADDDAGSFQKLSHTTIEMYIHT